MFFVDEVKRKQLIKRWALNWRDFTYQPIDEIYSYFGMKVSYFEFDVCGQDYVQKLLIVCLIIT